MPILRARFAGLDGLRIEKRDYIKMKLVDVFLRMHEIGRYAVASDLGLMTFLEQQVAGMEDPLWKKITIRKITLIKEDAG